jgi:hypothetical protein
MYTLLPAAAICGLMSSTPGLIIFTLPKLPPLLLLALKKISRQQQQSAFDSFGLAGLIERSRFGFVPLGMASRYGINRLIDNRNCYELIQRGFVISKNNLVTKGNKNNNNNHEQIRTLEELVSRDKGGIIISPQVGLHENVVSLDYHSEKWY